MRTDSTLGVIFFTRKKRNDPEKLDIYVRITVNKRRAEFSIKRDIAVCNWNIFRCRAKRNRPQNLILLNTYLDDVYAEVLNAHKQLHSERKLITAKAIKAQVPRGGRGTHDFDEGRRIPQSLICNKTLKWGTLKNYFSTEKYLESISARAFKDR